LGSFIRLFTGLSRANSEVLMVKKEKEINCIHQNTLFISVYLKWVILILDLSVEFAGMKLRNPVTVASSPLTATLYRLKQASKYGASAASTKLAFIKQPFIGNLQLYSEPGNVLIVPYDKRLDMDEAVELIRRTKEETDLVLLANMTHTAHDLKGWKRLALALEEAGADIIELNFVCPNIELTAEQLGLEVTESARVGGSVGLYPELSERVTKAVKESVRVPVVCKLTPEAADITAVAKACEKAGADAIAIGGNYLSLPRLDIYNNGRPLYPSLDKTSFGALAGPCVRHAAYRTVAQLYRDLKIPILGGGGITSWRDVVEMMMWGATMISICTSIMWYGFELIERTLKGLEKFMDEKGYESPKEFIGCAVEHLTSSDNLRHYYHPTVAVVNKEKCNGCIICTRPGHCEAIEMKDNKAVIDSKLCVGCGVCQSLCPQNAITMKGV